MALKLKNTLSGKLEEFKPINSSEVRMYNCGPTVYDYAHIGNMRAYVFADILKRVLKYNGYEVAQVINITDVGHLSESKGLDKVEEKAKKVGKSAKEIAEFFTKHFFEDLDRLNIDTDGTIFPKATEHVNEQIELIKLLEARGFTYKTSQGLYFDTGEFYQYGKLGNVNVDELKEGARLEEDKEKKNPADFALWRLSQEAEKRQQEWPSPWGVGFPGWHIECSAMGMKYLGEEFDIHTGGVDHIFPHHNNEIAQSESATGKPFVHYWLHNAFLNIKGDKLSKSENNFLILEDIVKKGIKPLAYRYWLLTSNYDSPINFTWQALQGAAIALNKLLERFQELPDGGRPDENYRALFKGMVNDNLNTPKALALVWDLLKDFEVAEASKKATLQDFDKVLGLGLDKAQLLEIPAEVQKLLNEREIARKGKDWNKSDQLRDKVAELGFEIKDTPNGQKVSPKSGS